MSEGSQFKGGLALAVLGVAMLGAGLIGIVPAIFGASGYEQVQVTVVETGVEEFQSDGEYMPAVVYQYAVDGETYRSDNFYRGPTEPAYSKSKARDRISGYTDGANATAYVDRDDPSRAFLERQTLGERVLNLAGYAVAILLGAPLCFGGGKLAITALRGTDE